MGLTEKSKLTITFLKRKMDEYESLRAEIESLQTKLKDEHQTDLSPLKSK